MLRTQNENRHDITPSEQHVMDLLTELGERFIFEKAVFATHTFFLIDFYLPKPRKLCIEIDGPYHAKQVWYDRQRDEFLTKERKMKVLRITNERADRLNKNQLLELINAL
jgi:very-short-patch-repair endonuclease